MGVTLQYGPDGAVYSLDWSDTGECHSVKNTQRETGRIFKIAYGEPQHVERDLAKLTSHELIELHTSRNEWWVRHARRNLQERAAAGESMNSMIESLLQAYQSQTNIPKRLRLLWTSGRSVIDRRRFGYRNPKIRMSIYEAGRFDFSAKFSVPARSLLGDSKRWPSMTCPLKFDYT